MSYTRVSPRPYPCARELAALIVCLTLGLSGVQARQSQLSVITSSPFESYLESLRAQAGIPGMSAALVQDGTDRLGARVRLPESGSAHPGHARYALPGRGHQPDARRGPRPAVRRGTPAVNRRAHPTVRRRGARIPSATLRQVLSHTSAGAGEVFRYEPERYAQLTPVVESCVPQPYRKTVAVNLLERLAMKDSVPGRDLVDPTVLTERLFSSEILERYTKVLERIAVPYKVDNKKRATRTEVAPEGINAATGLITTVRDYARFDAAIDEAVLLRVETRRGRLVARHDRLAHGAPHWARMVRADATAANPSSGTSASSRTATRRSSSSSRPAA